MSRVLIIDDEPQMRRLLRQALERAGYEVDEAIDGLQALARLADSRPDLVITDIIMPQREGLETILALRQEFPTIPIIAMSGGGRQSHDDYLAVAQDFGAERVFHKPFRIDAMLTAVSELLGGFSRVLR